MTIARILEFIGNHLFLASLFAALLMLLLWNLYRDSLMRLKSITPAQATRMINDQDALLIDARPSADFKDGHIISAQNIPEGEFQDSLARLKKHAQQSVIVYCNSGSTSPYYVRRLMQAGFAKTYYLKGGLIEWRNAKLPLSR